MALLGWGKASKCKKLLKKSEARLECLKNERLAIAKHLQEAVEKMMTMIKEVKGKVHDVDQDHDRNGDVAALSFKIEHMIRDECLVFELLDYFCKFIRKEMFYIRTHKRLCHLCGRTELSAAVSSLVFASSRIACGEIPELEEIRDLFLERYGKDFVAATVQLLPGNLVNRLVKDKLPIDVKHQLIKEIAESYEIRKKESHTKHVHPRLPEHIFACALSFM